MRLLFFVAALASAATCQVSATLVAETPLTVAYGGVVATAPAGANLASGLSLRASLAGTGGPACTSQCASLEIGLSQTPEGITYTHSEVADTLGSILGVGVDTGPHSTIFRLTSPTPINGSVVVDWKGSSNGYRFQNAGVLADVDIGADGTIEFSHQVTDSQLRFQGVFPVRVTPSGVAIRTTTHGYITAALFATGGPDFHSELTVRFAPTTLSCTATAYGVGCCSGSLTAGGVFGNLLVVADDLVPLSPAWLLVGVQPTNLTLTTACGASCPLLTSPVVALPLPPMRGSARASLQIPPVRPLQFDVQVARILTVPQQLLTTHALAITCN